MTPALVSAVESAVRSATGRAFACASIRRQGGGCIHPAFKLTGADTSLFVKTNSADRLALFETEADSLRALATTATVRVPGVIAVGSAADASFLVLEHLDLRPGSAREQGRLGAQLAALHRHLSGDGRFGWPSGNFIGRTPQANAWSGNWLEFWRTRRLEPQFRLAADRGAAFPGAARLLDRMEVFFAGHRPQPSLLHGDLWSGNASFATDGEPVLFDPACYHGDRETDLAFASLFGGFAREFFQAYDGSWPRDPGWQRRVDLYNLYHVLNHFHLFGGTYRSQAEQMIRRLNQEAAGG